MQVHSDSLSISRARGHGLAHFDYPFLAGALYSASDLFAAGFAGLVAHQILLTGQAIATPVKLAMVVGLLLTRLIFSKAGLYDSWRGRSLFEQTGRLLIGWLGVITSLIIIAFLLGVSEHFSRAWLLLWLIMGWLLIGLARSGAALVLRFVRSRGWNHKRIAVVGGGDWSRTIVRRLNNAAWLGLDVVTILDDNRDRHGDLIDGVKIRGGFELLPTLIGEGGVDEVWICLPISSGRAGKESRLDRVLDLLKHSTVTHRLVPNLAEMRLLNHPMTQIMDLPVVNLSVSPMRMGFNRVLKGLEDRLLALLIVVLGSPVFLAIAIAVKLSSPGPVLFRQRRHGWDGKPITIYKFRTMVIHQEEDGRVTQARKGDARVTRVGAFLRRTSLDELPQFINVLQGRMSVVGPRPHAIEHNHYYMDQIDSYMQRHKVKPGITGWAQVNGLRGATDTLEKMRRRVEYDLYYIDNWSIWLDVKIILLTLVRGFTHPNAY